jgi:C_GCAxxG_C_C family probable redox protein
MNVRIQRATDCFEQGYNCAQAVFSAFAPEFGLERETALRIADPLGAGVGRLGKTCGAVSGALLAIGLRHGRQDAGDAESKERAYALAREMVKRFAALYGSIVCHDLLGRDISTSDGMAAAREEDLFTTRCPEFVRGAAEIVDLLLRPTSCAAHPPGDENGEHDSRE